MGRPTALGGPVVRAPAIEDVREAAERLRDVAVRTPLLTLPGKDGLMLKPEVLQPIGSFKLRGVYNWVASLAEVERRRGLSTHSAGNTALAVGYVARLFGVSARTLVSDLAPEVKVRAIESYGATPVIRPFNEILDFVFAEGWKSEPYNFLNPWGESSMIAGNGTIGLEILEDYPEIETVYVPVGGGGLIAGVGGAIKTLRPSVRLVAVQVEACSALRASLDAGRPVWVDAGPTMCEGVAVPFISDEMFPLLRELVDEVVVVSEDAVREAIGLLAMGSRLVAEGAGALSVAAALSMPAERRGATVCIVSGGLIEPKTLAAILGGEPEV